MILAFSVLAGTVFVAAEKTLDLNLTTDVRFNPPEAWQTVLAEGDPCDPEVPTTQTYVTSTLNATAEFDYYGQFCCFRANGTYMLMLMLSRNRVHRTEIAAAQRDQLRRGGR